MSARWRFSRMHEFGIRFPDFERFTRAYGRASQQRRASTEEPAGMFRRAIPISDQMAESIFKEQPMARLWVRREGGVVREIKGVQGEVVGSKRNPPKGC